MKRLYRPLFPIAGFVLLAATVLRAEPPAPNSPPDRREHRDEMKDSAKKMAKELNLTPAQEVQTEAIRKQTADAMKALRNDTSLSDEQRRAKSRELRKTSEDQINALLTPEQRIKAKEFRKKQGPRGPGEKPPGGHPSEDMPPPPPAN